MAPHITLLNLSIHHKEQDRNQIRNLIKKDLLS